MIYQQIACTERMMADRDRHLEHFFGKLFQIVIWDSPECIKKIFDKRSKCTLMTCCSTADQKQLNGNYHLLVWSVNWCPSPRWFARSNATIKMKYWMMQAMQLLLQRKHFVIETDDNHENHNDKRDKCCTRVEDFLRGPVAVVWREAMFTLFAGMFAVKSSQNINGSIIGHSSNSRALIPAFRTKQCRRSSSTTHNRQWL